MSHIKTIVILLCIFLINCKSKKENTPAPAPEAAAVNVIPSTETIGLNLGNKAPEIAEKNQNDSLVSLSSLKGKMVLIDFWASWCAPCRQENPNVVKAYSHYKDKNFKTGKGFTIYSVSLDEKKESWKKAIEKDNLSWPYHVSDLKGWNNEAALKYNITGIPYNFLINGEGIIVAINLRSESLSKTLDKYLSE